MRKITSWVQKHRLESLFLAFLLLVASLLRLYRIDEYMTFLGDEGRDAIIVRNLLVHFDPILIGPGTSIGNMYLGPHYYYLIAPFLFLANFSPVGPSVMVALFGVLTVFLIWLITKEWFGQDRTGVSAAGIIASALFAISPVVIIYSRSSWNPNVMPFFALVSIYSIWRVYRHLDYRWMFVLAFSFAMALNSHYLALLITPVLGIYWALTFLKTNSWKLKIKTNKEIRNFTKKSLLSFLVFLTLMSPLVIFDARHNWVNFSAMKKFFTVRQETVSIKPWSSLNEILPISEKITTRLVAGTDVEAGKFIFWSLVVIGVALLLVNRKRIFSKDILESPYLLIAVWLVVSVMGLSLYKQEIYDHYYGFFFPAPFILVGAIAQEASKRIRFFGGLFAVVLLGYLVIVNFANSPLKYPPNRQLQRSEAVAEYIGEESKGREFNLAVIAERNYEGAYQYFLERYNNPLKAIDPQLAEETITDQLFVVCELPADKCDPTHNPKAGIANFGWSRVESQKEVEGVIVYKLVHYEEGRE